MAGHTGDVATATAGLTDDDPAVRATALGALERLGALADAALASALGDADGAVRRRAVTIAAAHPGVDLDALLDDGDPAVVEAAAWAAGERDAVAPSTLSRVIAVAADHPEPLARESAVAALGAIGDDRGLTVILHAATADRPAIRRRAVLALAPFTDPEHPRASEVATALVAAAADRDWQVRQAAEDITPSPDDTPA